MQFANDRKDRKCMARLLKANGWWQPCIEPWCTRLFDSNDSAPRPVLQAPFIPERTTTSY